MKCFVAVAALLGLGSAEPFLYNTPIITSYASAIAPSIHAAPAIHAVPAYRTVAAPIRSIQPVTPAVTYSGNLIASAPAPVSAYVSEPVVRTAPVATIRPVPSGVTASQYHSQDEFGNYAYGYENQNSQKHEAGNARTGVQGHYSYVDGAGLNRRVDYVADGLGFRASGTGLLRKKRSLAYGLSTFATPSLVSYPAVPYSVPAYAAAPQVVRTAPVATIRPIPSGVTASQYHSQDELGNYAYGYQNQNSEKHEAGNAYTGVQGHYSYVDPYGLNRRVDYVADAAGFRASGRGILRKKRSLAYGLSPYAAVPSYSGYPFTTAAYAAPVVTPIATQPIVQAPVATIRSVPSDVTASQYHTQDEYGNYAYGYQNENSEKEEAGNVHTGVRGHYSYVDGFGLNRRVDYVADGLGFRHI